MWFWREVVDYIPLTPESFRILHPEIIHRTGQVLQKYALKQGNVSSNMLCSCIVVCFHTRLHANRNSRTIAQLGGLTCPE